MFTEVLLLGLVLLMESFFGLMMDLIWIILMLHLMV